METAEQLAKNNPTEEPTLYLGDKEKGEQSPLNGEWKLLFTTAADATFSKNSTRGDAKVKNVVDASRGRITNVIDFPSRNGAEPLLKQLERGYRCQGGGEITRGATFSICQGGAYQIIWLEEAMESLHSSFTITLLQCTHDLDSFFP